MKAYEVVLSMHSLHFGDLVPVKELLSKAANELNMPLFSTEERLKKAGMKDYENISNCTDGAILVHRNSGRLLMTG